MLTDCGLVKHVHEACDEKEVIRKLVEYPINIILLEINLPVKKGLNIISALRKEFPGVKILIISSYKNQFLVNTIIDMGVHGYLLKEDVARTADLELALVQLQKKRFFLSESLNRADDYRYRSKPCTASHSETLFIRLLSEGKNSREISIQTGLTISSVETYRKRLLKKFKVVNTSALVKYGFEVGLLDR